MQIQRRDFLRLAGGCLAGGATGLWLPSAMAASRKAVPGLLPGMAGNVFGVHDFGATGNGKTPDTAAINRAIEGAAAAGGGVVHLPAGTYLCYSLHLKSRVTLYLDQGATILAADTPREGTPNGYDAIEPNQWDAYQDFGHSHWHNSLIWGENLHDVAILGPGLIWGKGLSRGHKADADRPIAECQGVGNKAIALKNCHNVTLRDFSVLAGGHFALLATGVDNLVIDNLHIDTNRDGLDIDCCRNVRVTDCSVNSPWDDGICPKCSYALGELRPTENVTITGCYVTGAYQMGTLLDGSFQHFEPAFYDNFWNGVGRIKCGTESNGGFRNITIANCIFEGCRGLALETVDGAPLEDITVTGCTMRGIRNSPLYFRLGARMRGPKTLPSSTFRRVLISNLSIDAPFNTMPSLINGIPGHAIEDIRFSDITITQRGGWSAELNGWNPPEREFDYPEPYRYGPLPAFGFFLRHVRNAEFSHVEIATNSPDARAALWLDDVADSDFSHLALPASRKGPAFVLNQVSGFRLTESGAMADTRIARIDHKEF